MNKILISLACFVFLMGFGGVTFAQVPPEVEWNKTFGGPNDDLIRSIQQTLDGGYIIAGSTKSFGAGGYDGWLIKTDSNGNEQWNKTFGGPNHETAYSIQQTSDGGYIISGFTRSFGAGLSDVWLIKTDVNGNEEWNKTFNEAADELTALIQQTSDGDYIIGIHTDSLGAGQYDIWLVKLKGPFTSINTLAGTNVTVEFADEDTNITFNNVTESGQTTVTVSTSGPSPPSGFNLSGSYYDITTTANYTGDITICINYNESQVGDESALKLFHYEDGSWADVTTSLDTDANSICGTVTSLSPFIIVEPTTTTTIPATIDIDPDTLNLKSQKMVQAHHGRWITAYIELPDGYNVSLIDINTVELTYNGTGIPAVNNTKYGFVTKPDSYITDNDEDGILERMVKFDRSAVIDQVKAQNLTLPADVELTVTGKVFYNSGETDFEGSDTIRVIEKDRH